MTCGRVHVLKDAGIDHCACDVGEGADNRGAAPVRGGPAGEGEEEAPQREDSAQEEDRHSGRPLVRMAQRAA